MKYCLKLISLSAVIFLLNSMTASGSPGEKQIDSLAQINQYKKDSANAKRIIDSLTKIIGDNDENAKPNPTIFAGGSVAIYLVGIIISLFVIYIAKTSPKDFRYALGLPDGSIRAIIAILAIVFYILASLALSHLVTKSTIPSDVIKTLGTLVVAISAFYFGAKTAEQGSKTATANLTTLLANSNNSDSNSGDSIPIQVVQQAINNSMKDWMDLYKATKIEPGKKKTEETTHEVNCIVFFVDSKSSTPAPAVPGQLPAKSIPPIISYNSNGRVYNIPTDVRENPAK